MLSRLFNRKRVSDYEFEVTKRDMKNLCERIMAEIADEFDMLTEQLIDGKISTDTYLTLGNTLAEEAEKTKEIQDKLSIIDNVEERHQEIMFDCSWLLNISGHTKAIFIDENNKGNLSNSIYNEWVRRSGKKDGLMIDMSAISKKLYFR